MEVQAPFAVVPVGAGVGLCGDACVALVPVPKRLPPLLFPSTSSPQPCTAACKSKKRIVAGGRLFQTPETINWVSSLTNDSCSSTFSLSCRKQCNKLVISSLASSGDPSHTNHSAIPCK